MERRYRTVEICIASEFPVRIAFYRYGVFLEKKTVKVVWIAELYLEYVVILREFSLKHHDVAQSKFAVFDIHGIGKYVGESYADYFIIKLDIRVVVEIIERGVELFLELRTLPFVEFGVFIFVVLEYRLICKKFAKFPFDVESFDRVVLYPYLHPHEYRRIVHRA